MGNYNREYEKYYNKINKKHKTSPKMSNSKRELGPISKRKNEGIGKYMVSDILFSSVVSGFIFFAFFSVKGMEIDWGVELCNKFKEIILTDGYYKELALEESSIVSAISKNFEMNNKINEVNNEDNLESKDMGGEDKLIDKVNDESEKAVEGFNSFSVVEKTDLDFLKESKVVPFNGVVSTLDDYDLGGDKVYIKGDSSSVKAILSGNIIDVKEENGVYTVLVKYSDGLEIKYHNLREVNIKKGDFVKADEVLGKSAINDKLNGIVVQIIWNGEYLNPKEYLNFLGANSSEAK